MSLIGHFSRNFQRNLFLVLKVFRLPKFSDLSTLHFFKTFMKKNLRFMLIMPAISFFFAMIFIIFFCNELISANQIIN
uniref:Uncharacterized protein n=1 Tax=Onchocerca volvulus TaxID=6282 RepID=A0A8R1TZC3_ONCVO